MNSDEIQTHPAKSQLTLEEPASYDEDTEPAEKVDKTEIGTDQDPELDSDEEEIVESVAEGQRRRYPLREKGTPDAEEGPQSNLRDERLGSGKTDIGDAHHLEPVKEATMVVTGETCD